uniref:pentapeptide repeat-containing protein n=1 Tax=Mobiluncus mulieris TaxID=2052 RepID=UPI003315F833
MRFLSWAKPAKTSVAFASRGIGFRGADFRGSGFRGADFPGSSFRSVGFRGALVIEPSFNP